MMLPERKATAVMTDDSTNLDTRVQLKLNSGTNMMTAQSEPIDAETILRQRGEAFFVRTAVMESRIIFITKFSAKSTSAYTVTFNGTPPAIQYTLMYSKKFVGLCRQANFYGKFDFALAN